MNQYDIELQYQSFLAKMALDEKKMHPTQKEQLRQTFYGAIGIMLILFRDELALLPEDQGVQELEKMFAQVQGFWISQKPRTNKASEN